MRACVCSCVRACVRACVGACVRVSVCMRACVCLLQFSSDGLSSTQVFSYAAVMYDLCEFRPSAFEFIPGFFHVS